MPPLATDPTWLKYFYVFWWDSFKIQLLTNPGVQVMFLQTVFLGFIVYYLRKILKRMDKWS